MTLISRYIPDGIQTDKLIEEVTAENLIADKGYDSEAVVEQAAAQGMKPQTPPQKKQNKCAKP